MIVKSFVVGSSQADGSPPEGWTQVDSLVGKYDQFPG